MIANKAIDLSARAWNIRVGKSDDDDGVNFVALNFFFAFFAITYDKNTRTKFVCVCAYV